MIGGLIDNTLCGHLTKTENVIWQPGHNETNNNDKNGSRYSVTSLICYGRYIGQA